MVTGLVGVDVLMGTACSFLACLSFLLGGVVSTVRVLEWSEKPDQNLILHKPDCWLTRTCLYLRRPCLMTGLDGACADLCALSFQSRTPLVMTI